MHVYKILEDYHWDAVSEESLFWTADIRILLLLICACWRCKAWALGWSHIQRAQENLHNVK